MPLLLLGECCVFQEPGVLMEPQVSKHLGEKGGVGVGTGWEPSMLCVGPGKACPHPTRVLGKLGRVHSR